VVQLRLRAVYRCILALGIYLEVRRRLSMIHWDWVLTLVAAVFIVKAVELFGRVLIDAVLRQGDD
jgi:hypothetical protein